MHDGLWKPIAVNLVGHGADDVDFSILAPRQLFGASNILSISVEIIISETVYFLGLPYDLILASGNLNQHFPLPLVKKAIISGVNMDGGAILFDGHNNPGFSGGPVVRETEPSQVIGIVSNYISVRQYVEDNDGNRGP